MTFDSFSDAEHLYFITATICGWKHLLEMDPYMQIILDSFTWLREKGRMLLFAYVVMPNHAHMILKPKDIPISRLLHDFGSVTAHKIIKMLKRDEQSDWLDYFHSQRRDERSNYSVWQDIQAKNVYSDKFLIQKMEYIHNNPAVERWGLVKDRADYLYSSACFYDRGKTGIIDIDDIREYLDIESSLGFREEMFRNEDKFGE